MTRTLATLVLASALVACGGPGPADELTPALNKLVQAGAPSVPATAILYGALDAAGQAAIDARAAALSAELGRKVQPFEAIQFRGFAPNARIDEVESTMTGDNTATLHVTFVNVSDAGNAPMPEPLDLAAVREDGHWKLSLPELSAHVSVAAPAQPVTP